jgi:hypothetical protein
VNALVLRDLNESMALNQVPATPRCRPLSVSSLLISCATVQVASDY